MCGARATPTIVLPSEPLARGRSLKESRMADDYALGGACLASHLKDLAQIVSVN